MNQFWPAHFPIKEELRKIFKTKYIGWKTEFDCNRLKLILPCFMCCPTFHLPISCIHRIAPCYYSIYYLIFGISIGPCGGDRKAKEGNLIGNKRKDYEICELYNKLRLNKTRWGGADFSSVAVYTNKKGENKKGRKKNDVTFKGEIMRKAGPGS